VLDCVLLDPLACAPRLPASASNKAAKDIALKPFKAAFMTPPPARPAELPLRSTV
jgi:hypothetical protein